MSLSFLTTWKEGTIDTTTDLSHSCSVVTHFTNEETENIHLMEAASLCMRASHTGSCAICWVPSIPSQCYTVKLATHWLIWEVITGRISVAPKINLRNHSHFMPEEQQSCITHIAPHIVSRVVSPSDSLHPRLQVEHGETRTKKQCPQISLHASLMCILKYKMKVSYSFKKYLLTPVFCQILW